MRGDVGDVAQERSQEASRGIGAGMVRKPPAPERNPEEGLGGDGAMRRVPAGMRAEEHREEPGGVTAVQDGTQRLEHLPPDLGKLRPVELRQAIPCGALERLERGEPRPRGGPGVHEGSMPDHCGSVPLRAAKRGVRRIW